MAEKGHELWKKLMLLDQDIQILDALIPKMVLDINIIDSRVEEISSFSFNFASMDIVYLKRNIINPCLIPKLLKIL